MQGAIGEAPAAADETQPSQHEKGAALQTNAHHPRSNRRNRWTLATCLLAIFCLSQLPVQIELIACHSWCATSCWHAAKHANMHHVRSYSGLHDVLAEKGFSPSNNNTNWDDLVNTLSAASSPSWTDSLLWEKWQLLATTCLTSSYLSWVMARSVFPIIRSGNGIIANICMGCPCIEAPIGKALRWICNRYWALLILGVAMSAFASEGIETIASTLKSLGRQRWGCDWPGTGWFILDEALSIILWGTLILLGQRIVKTIHLSEDIDQCKN